MCLWQCNWTAPSTSEPTLQSLSLGDSLSPSHQCWRLAGKKGRRQSYAGPAGHTAVGVAAAGPGCKEGAPFWHQASHQVTSEHSCPIGIAGKWFHHFPSTSLVHPQLSTFGKKDRRKTDVHRMESNIQEIRAAEHHLKQIPHFNFFTYSISG